MISNTHQISAQVLQAVARGDGGPAPIQVLLAGQRSKNMLMIRAVVDSAVTAGHAEAAIAEHGYELLTRVEHVAPGAVQRVLRHPAVGAWALQTVLARQSAPPATVHPGRLASVAAAAAIRAGVPCEIELARPGGQRTVDLPSLGRLRIPDYASGRIWLRSNPVSVELSIGDAAFALLSHLDDEAPGWRPIPIVTAGMGSLRISLALDDVDSCRFPGYPGLPEQLSRAELNVWLGRLTNACNILINYHPDVAAEVAALIVAVTPLPAPRHGQVSASSRHAFGCAALSLPADDVSLALALTHEVQHAKLGALMDLIPMITATARGHFYAPWREDARPLTGLLHGAYAHIGIAYFWRRHRHVLRDQAKAHYAHTEFARWRDASALTVEFLSSCPELTGGGQLFVAGMAQRLCTWHRDFVPIAALEDADRAAQEHLERWVRREDRVAQ